jgi:hypothetical protein
MIELFDISKTRLGRFQLHPPYQLLNFFRPGVVGSGLPGILG